MAHEACSPLYGPCAHWIFVGCNGSGYTSPSTVIKHIAFLPKMEIEQVRKSFSYVEPCIRRWELIRSTRKLAIKGGSFIEAEDGSCLSPPPSLSIISKNFEVLKGFTSHMAETGVICTRLIGPLKKAVVAYYELMGRDTSSDQAQLICHQVASSLKKMLRMVRFKWKRWEMPRAPQI